MKKIKYFFLFIIPLFMLFSCSEKKYRLVMTKIDSDLGGRPVEEEDEEVISAKNDTLAYIKAYRKFKISQKFDEYSEDLEALFRKKTLDFKLYDLDGNDISNIDFATKIKEEQQIDEDVLSIKDPYENIKKSEVSAVNSNFDSITYNKLIAKFTIKDEEFSSPKVKWVIPKNKPKYINKNGVYSYFQADKNNNASNLRFVVQYTADDWLFIKKIQLLVDDNLIDLPYFELKTDHDGGEIWEWTDLSMPNDLKVALENAKKVKIKLTGNNYAPERVLSQKEVNSLIEVITLYKAMGGS